MNTKTSSTSDSFLSFTQSPDRRRKLIDQCTDEWQNSKKYRESLPIDNTHSTWSDERASTIQRAWAVVKAPKFQRSMAIFLMTFAICVLVWRNFLSAFIAENQAAWETINAEGQAKHGNVFGSNKRVHFPGVVHMRTMDQKYLPRDEKSKVDGTGKDKRLIFVGDIHGCMTELKALLAKVKHVPENDHIIALGDMINKGPNSLEVIDFLMEAGASCVRGNHEDRILLVANDITRHALKALVADEKPEVDSEGSRNSRMERDIARSLSPKQLHWLNSCPVILKIGEMKSHGEIVAVHGGLVPGIRLEDQDPISVMNMRIINTSTLVPSPEASDRGSVPWADFWNKHQKLWPARNLLFGDAHKGHPFKHTTVVYGHDAKRGMQIDTYTKGLDSGCVKGGKLTAWVVGGGGRNEIVQVKSKNHPK